MDWYNYVRINSAVRMRPAIASGVSDRLCTVSEIAKLIEEWNKKKMRLKTVLAACLIANVVPAHAAGGLTERRAQ